MAHATIVVVDDEPMTRLVAVDAFERAGFDVVDFGRTDEALSYAASSSDAIAALFTDIVVPGDEDGLDLARRFADLRPQARIILTSGRFGADWPHGLPGQFSYLAKPWTAKALLDHVRAALPPAG